ncbi:putative methyltransferase PMT5, partial [Mucuna pruriens]
MRSSWLKKLSYIIGPRPPLSWLILCLISLLALIAVLHNSSSSTSSSNTVNSARSAHQSLIYTNYRRIKEQAAIDYLDLRSVSTGSTRQELEVCGKERENFVPCHNVSANLMTGFKEGEEFDRHCEVSKGTKRCLVRPPKEYKTPLQWPSGRDVIWSANVKITKDQFLSSGSMTK